LIFRFFYGGAGRDDGGGGLFIVNGFLENGLEEVHVDLIYMGDDSLTLDTMTYS